MGEKVDAKVIKKTQDTLGKIIKKPPLTDKLLSKPPFRFLHDIVTSTIKTTGFMKGLFTETEMSSDNVKDKESKVAFLQKVIDMVSLVLGKTISAKPTKIVSGQDPERTNELLAAIAEAINKKVKNDEYVQRVLQTGGDGKASGSSKKESSKKKEKEDDSKSKSRDRDGKSRDKSREADSEKSRDKERSKERSKDKDRDRSKDRRDKDKSRDESREGRDEKDKERRKRREEKEKAKESTEAEPMTNGTHEDQRANTMKVQQEEHVRQRERERSSKPRDEGVGEDDLPPQVAAARKMQRPSSARPAPPKVKKNDAPEEPVMIGSSNVPNLIVDKDDSDDDDDGFMAKEEEEPQTLNLMSEKSTTEVDEEGEHGGLVKKILETKKELEGGSQAPGKKTEIERSQVPDATRRKEREMIQKEIDKLRTSIQTLTRSVNPLGKILDFLQEDLDSMQKEQAIWQAENKENAVSLQREMSITESSIEPLKAQLTELDAAINDQLDLIAAVKHNIIKNDDKVEKMLSTVTKS